MVGTYINGLVNGRVVVKNARLAQADPEEVEALADSSALHLCILDACQDSSPSGAEVLDRFGAASYETQKVEGHWRYGGIPVSRRYAADRRRCAQLAKNRERMKGFKTRWHRARKMR